MDDRKAERFDPAMAGRPSLIKGNTQLLFPGMIRLSENSVVNIKNKSHSVTAEIVVPASGAEGVILAQGGAYGGWSVYAKGGKLKYCYNFLGLERYYAEATTPIPAGEHQVRMEFAYDGGGLGKGGTITLYVDGKPIGTGRVEHSEAMVFSGDETTDVGEETGSTVTPDYPLGHNAFSGKINWIQIDLGKDDHDHLISHEERLSLAVARQ
jgi:hypothetical protein